MRVPAHASRSVSGLLRGVGVVAAAEKFTKFSATSAAQVRGERGARGDI